MGFLRSGEDPALRMAKLMAVLYYCLSKEILDCLGKEEGKRVVGKAIREFAGIRLANMYEEAEERGLRPLGLEAYLEVRDMPSTGWEKVPGKPFSFAYCPLEDTWRKMGEQGLELGALYCDIDYDLFAGFGLELVRPACRITGQQECEFVLRRAK